MFRSAHKMQRRVVITLLVALQLVGVRMFIQIAQQITQLHAPTLEVNKDQIINIFMFTQQTIQDLAIEAEI